MLIIITSDSGSLNSEWEDGNTIVTSSCGLNCVVSMKKVSSRKATSTSGVMSILTPCRCGLNFGIGFSPPD